MTKSFSEKTDEERKETLNKLDKIIDELKELADEIMPELFESIQEKYEDSRNNQ